MIILKQSYSWMVNENMDGSIVEFSDGYGSSFEFIDNKLVNTNFSFGGHFAKVQINSINFNIYSNGLQSKFSYLPEHDGTLLSIKGEFEKNREIISRIICYLIAIGNSNDEKVIFNSDSFDDFNLNKETTYIFDTKSFELISLDGIKYASNYWVGSDAFTWGNLGFGRKSSSLDVLWKVSIDKSEDYTSPFLIYDHLNSTPQILEKNVIFNLASRHASRYKTVSYKGPDGDIVEQEEPDPYFTDGKVICADYETGDLVWEKDFEFQVDDIIALPNNDILVISERYLFIINSNSGEVIRQWDSGIRDGDRVYTGQMQLLLADGNVFLFSHKDCRFQIYDAISLDLIRTVDGVDRGLMFGARRPKVVGSKILVPTDLRNDSFSGGVVFVIETDKLDAEIEDEKGPELKITEPSESSPGPIVCEVDYPDYGNMFRFVERALISRVILNSATYTKEHFQPRTVKLIYSGYSDSKELIEEKMEVFKKRFARMVDEPHIPGIGMAPVEVEYELL